MACADGIGARCTTLAIAQPLAMVRRAGRAIMLDQGRVVATGILLLLAQWPLMSGGRLGPYPTIRNDLRIYPFCRRSAAHTAAVTAFVVACPPKSGVCSTGSAVTRSIARINRSA